MQVQLRMSGWIRVWIIISVFWIGYFAYRSIEAYSLITSAQERIIHLRAEQTTIILQIHAIIPKWSAIDDSTQKFIIEEQQMIATKIASGLTIKELEKSSNQIAKIESLERAYSLNNLSLSQSISDRYIAKHNIPRSVIIGLLGPCVLLILGFLVIFLYKWIRTGFMIPQNSQNSTPIDPKSTKECAGINNEFCVPVESNFAIRSEYCQDRQSQVTLESQPATLTPELANHMPIRDKNPIATPTLADADYTQTGVTIASFIILFCGLLTVLFFNEGHHPSSSGATSNPGMIDLAIGIGLLAPKFRNTSKIFAIFRAWAGVILAPLLLFMSDFSSIAVIGYWLLSISLLLLLFKSKRFKNITKIRITFGAVLSATSVTCILLAPII